MNKPVLPWTKSITYEGDLTQDEMQLRDAVVSEYLHDRDWTAACKRLGMSSALALDYGRRFSEDAYVQRKLKEVEQAKATAPDITKKQELELEKQRIIEGLKDEAYYRGPGSSQAARVAAFKQLCSIFGFEAPKQAAVSVTATGVMMVPMMGSMEDWEKMASESQSKLQEDTLNGIKSLH